MRGRGEVFTYNLNIVRRRRLYVEKRGIQHLKVLGLCNLGHVFVCCQQVPQQLCLQRVTLSELLWGQHVLTLTVLSILDLIHFVFCYNLFPLMLLTFTCHVFVTSSEVIDINININLHRLDGFYIDRNIVNTILFEANVHCMSSTFVICSEAEMGLAAMKRLGIHHKF